MRQNYTNVCVCIQQWIEEAFCDLNIFFLFSLSAIGFGDLTPELQEELQKLQKRMSIELQPLVLESSLTMQKIIEAKDHTARCKLLNYFMQAETKRLETKKSLQGLFSSDSDTVLAENDIDNIPTDEMLPSTTESDEKKSGFYDEPDAWE